uniref:Globin n=1 Tax=Polypedilum nubifer TaxID=54969 RepID=V5YNF8_9DIPT|nr:globin [Polypedilum nubifer]
MKLIVLALCIVAAVAGPVWLSAEEAGLIRGSWQHIKGREVDLLYVIFKENPDIQAKFPAFVGKNLDELKGTAPFAEHAGRIIALVEKYVGYLGDDGNDAHIRDMLNEMGKKHAVRGVTREQFQAFRKSALTYIKGHVEWSEPLGAAWKLAFDKMYEVVFSNLP